MKRAMLVPMLRSLVPVIYVHRGCCKSQDRLSWQDDHLSMWVVDEPTLGLFQLPHFFMSLLSSCWLFLLLLSKVNLRASILHLALIPYSARHKLNSSEDLPVPRPQTCSPPSLLTPLLTLSGKESCNGLRCPDKPV